MQFNTIPLHFWLDVRRTRQERGKAAPAAANPLLTRLDRYGVVKFACIRDPIIPAVPVGPRGIFTAAKPGGP